MALQSYSLAVGNLEDVDGKNYSANTPVYVTNAAGVAQQLYRDIGGTIPIAQDGIDNQTDSSGEFTFFVEEGNWVVSAGGQKKTIYVIGPDYFNNQIEAVSDSIIEKTNGVGVTPVVGDFTTGFTFTDINQAGTYNNGGTIEYYIFTGGESNLDHVVPPNTNPVGDSNYQKVALNSIDTVTGLRDELDATNEKITWLQFPLINVQKFGAKLDGTDDTSSFLSALNEASNGGTVLIPQGIMRIQPTTLPSTLKGLYCIGTILGDGTSGVDGVLSGDGLTGCHFRLKMDMSNGDRAAIKLTNSTENNLTGGNIDSFTDHPTLNHYGIWLHHGCSRNIVNGNTITGYTNPTQRGLLVNITADALPYGDYFNGGNASRPTSGLCNENIVEGNTLRKGSYSVNIQGGGWNVVNANICSGQNHRTFYASNTAYGNKFTNNQCLDFLSSAIVFAYGAEENDFSNNFCFTISAGGEAVVNINTGAKRNTVFNNYLHGRGLNYGVYMGCDAIGNEVEGNKIYWYFVAGIAIDSDWVSPRPTNCFYARPNYGPPPVGDRWAFNDSSDNILANNKIYNADPTRNVAAVSLAQIEQAASARVRSTVIDSNKVMSPTGLAYNLSIYEEVAGGVVDTKITNNINNESLGFLSANPSTTSGTWNDKVAHFADNSKLDELLVSEPIPLAAGAPSVETNSSVPTERYFSLDVNATISNFSDGYSGQEILIRMSSGSTITYGSGTIRTKGLTDITGRSSNDYVKFKLLNGVWFEIFRSWS